MREKFFLFVLLFFGLYFDSLNIFRFCLLSSIAHETGHIIAYTICMKKLPKIHISPFGIKMKNDIKDSKRLFITLFCGPAVNLLIFVSCLVKMSEKSTFNLYILALVNLIIFTINLLPVYYLDGGQMLGIVWNRYSENSRAFSRAIMAFLAVMVIYFTGGNIRILAGFGVFFIYFLINLYHTY